MHVYAEGKVLKHDNIIPDLRVEEIPTIDEGGQAVLQLLAYEDHWLRRFGQLDLMRKQPNEVHELTLRSTADEVWFVLEGEVDCVCRDLREASPSSGHEHRFALTAPARILIPFGVAFGWQAKKAAALMLRCATHQDGDHADDQRISLQVDG